MFLKRLQHLALLTAATSSFCFHVNDLRANTTDNQTDETTPVLVGVSQPFEITIEQDFELPAGIHSGAVATYNGLWVFIAGRTNGLHGFENPQNNFPVNKQNQVVYVVDPAKKAYAYKSLTDGTSGLSQAQIDSLSVTSPQYYQPANNQNVLYMTGGYGVDTQTGDFSTKPLLTAINVPGLIHWVVNPSDGETAAQHIRHLTHPIFQVTGGYMIQVDVDHPTLLVFGQNFTGYYSDTSNGLYSQQVRRFWINDDGIHLSVDVLPSKPSELNSNYRRRDLNVVPVILRRDGKYESELLALSGVFTTIGFGGVWTVPVEITPNGHCSMANPNKASTFKQGMNNYVCATMGMFSKSTGDMYEVLFGGITYGYFEDGNFETSAEIPFTNQVTAIKIDKKGRYSQYLLDTTYPTILVPSGPNQDNPWLFGAGAYFMVGNSVNTYNNGVINFDAIKGRTIVGYIVGGIQSSVPNTEVIEDSTSSNYVFRVVVTPK